MGEPLSEAASCPEFTGCTRHGESGMDGVGSETITFRKG